MCEELELIQTNLGIWNLGDWPIRTSIKQLNKPETSHGIYLVICQNNGKILVGEGCLGGGKNRICQHLYKPENKKLEKDLKQYGENSFFLWAIIPEQDEIKRKLIENKLQIYFGDRCYNRSKRQYPSHNELKSNNLILKRLNNYSKVQFKDGFDECWQSNYAPNTNGYSPLYYYKHLYCHHILMYILYYGDICCISRVIDHKCENKKCVNPKHLELVTNKENIRRYHKSDYTRNQILELYHQNISIKEIADKLQCTAQTVRTNVDFKFSSNYRGVTQTKHYNQSIGKIIFHNSIQIVIEYQHYTLGTYLIAKEAAQNRDYYVVKNNLLDKYTLNFHDIDYKNFLPYSTLSGKINKYLI